MILPPQGESGQLHCASQEFQVASGQVVESDDFMPIGEQPVHQICCL
jgi:hypothetical protein